VSGYLRACACGCVETASDGRLQQDAHKAMENFWQSVDQQDASKTKAVAATDIAQPAVPTGIERHRCSENIFSHFFHFFFLPKLGRPHFHIRQGNGEIEKVEPVRA
jgi:hypothetical protein